MSTWSTVTKERSGSPSWSGPTKQPPTASANGDRLDPAERLRTAVRLEKEAKSLKEEALRDLQAAIEEGRIEDDGQPDCYSFPGLRVTKRLRVTQELSDQGKERLQAFRQVLADEGFSSEKESWVWYTKLLEE